MPSAYPFPIPPEMYREQRQRLAATMRAELADHATRACLLQGGAELPIHSTDVCYPFIQESYFTYLFGMQTMADAYGLVLSDGAGLLFIPRLPEDFATWMGPLPTTEGVKAATGADAVYFADEMDRVLGERGIATLEVLDGVNSDSGLKVPTATPPAGVQAALSRGWLYEAVSRQRAYKTPLEAEVLRYVCKVSSDAHILVMQKIRPGDSQHMLEANFKHYCYHEGGCRRVSYGCICATGVHGATLHYPNNDAPITENDMALIDMGGNYCGYCADITCSYPASGRFSDLQRGIYLAVLDAHDRVLRAAKPGVSWVAMHTLAIRTTCEHLVRLGVLTGDVDALMAAEVMQYFQPHGLGHLIGIDVHDCGSYLSDCPARPAARDHCKLRTARVLEAGLYITIEPGCYFNHALMEKAFADPAVAPFVNEALIREKYWLFGGVRIESDVLVTADGVVNYTCVPRTIEEVEATMAGAPFSKEPEVLHN